VTRFERPRRALALLAFAALGAQPPAGCSLPLRHGCHTSDDCIAGECVAGVCGARQGNNDASPAASSLDSGGEPESRSGCGPAWADWPMPSPLSLTGFPDDPQRNLPNPHSYDTTAADVVVDNVTQLVWQKTVSPDLLTWDAAEVRCADLDLGGRADWRLPARIELVSLIDVTEWQLSNIDHNAFPGAPAEPLWSCSDGPANPLAAWFVDGGAGVGTEKKTVAHRVRCVAGAAGATPPPARYDLGTPGEVRDLKTQLTWKAATVPGLVNWGQAFDQCRGLGAGWRLPSVTELQTLIDETQAISAVSAAAFPDRPDDFFWSSSFFEETTNMVWFASIGSGNTFWLPTSESHRARCVR
jgi:hypothetical protein